MPATVQKPSLGKEDEAAKLIKELRLQGLKFLRSHRPTVVVGLEAQVNRHAEVAGLASSLAAFCQRVQASLRNATFDQKRRLVELLIDRVIATDDEVEIRYVIPTHPRSKHVRFCQLRKDYFQMLIQVPVRPVRHPVPKTF
jgi:hypothetical protein